VGIRKKSIFIFYVLVIMIIAAQANASGSSSSASELALDALNRGDVDIAFKLVKDALAEGVQDYDRSICRLVLARCLILYEKIDDALNILEGSYLDPYIGDVAYLVSFRALRTRDSQRALVLLDKMKTAHPGSLCLPDEETRADLLLKTGKASEAAEIFSEQANRGSGTSYFYQSKLREALARKKAGQMDSAKEILASLAHRNDLNSIAAKARIELEKIGGKAPDDSGELAKILIKEKRYRDAALEYGRLVSDRAMAGITTSTELRFDYAMALFHAHEDESALEQFDTLIASPLFSKTSEVLFRKAKLLSRMNQNAQAISAFQKLLKSGKGYEKQTLYQLALIDLEDGRYEKAYKYFAKRLSDRGVEREWLTWLAAWTAFRSEDFRGAKKYLDLLLSHRAFARSLDHDRYRYWRARVLLKLNQRSPAIKDLLYAASDSAFSYYAFKAREMLEQMTYSLPSGPREKLRQLGNSIRSPLAPLQLQFEEAIHLNAAKKAMLLGRLGMPTEAARHLDIIPFNEKNNGPESRYAFCMFSLIAGRPDMALNLARSPEVESYCRELDKPLFQTYYSLIYPQGYAGLVHEECRKQGVPPELAFAIIFHESKYKPWVVSNADAVGLMQLLPKTAEAVANRAGMGTLLRSDLMDPEINIRLGVMYLKQLMDEFGNRPLLIAAAYNAGPVTVKKWIQNKKDLPTEILAEEITYQETNRYVRMVTATMEIYKIISELSHEAGPASSP